MVSPLTKKLRFVATLFWSLGFAFVAFDRIYLLEIESANVRIAYLLFLLGGLGCWWAEKREFGLRVSLYHLHSLAIFGPWKYLLLYFLWVNLFAPFTDNPRTSVLYACGGWFSLVVVGLSAHLIFCEHTIKGVRLVFSRLRVAFFTYCISTILIAVSYLLHHLFPSLGIEPLTKDLLFTSFYFIAGFPFFVWDFVNPDRNLLPRPLVAFAVLGVSTVLFLFKVYPFIFALLFTLLVFTALGIYKRLRFLKTLGYLFVFCLLSVNLIFLYSQIPAPYQEYIQSALHSSKGAVKKEIKPALSDFSLVQSQLKETNYLGVGIGNSIRYRGIWLNILAEVGVLGILLYAGFFLDLLYRLYFVRRSKKIIVSNIAFISVLLFLSITSHYVYNPYGVGIWVWYALWSIFSTTHLKRGSI